MPALLILLYATKVKAPKLNNKNLILSRISSGKKFTHNAEYSAGCNVVIQSGINSARVQCEGAPMQTPRPRNTFRI